MNAEEDPGRKQYQAAYRLKNGGKVRAWNRAYYQRHRKEILARRKGRAACPAAQERDVLPKGWKVMFAVRGGVWSWQACKGAAMLENGGFGTLKEARRDCLAALGE